MIDELQLFRGQDFSVNDRLVLHHPTLTEICDFGEQTYFSMAAALTATPSDYKVVLWDQFGQDWQTIDEFEFFALLCPLFPPERLSILFGDYPLSRLQPAKNTQNDEFVLFSDADDLIFDRAAYLVTMDYLRRVHGFTKSSDRAGNDATRLYLLDKERRQARRQTASEAPKSILAPLISSMVNCEQFKYDHRSVWTLPLYTFMDSVRRIQRLKNYDQIMHGAYAGMVDLKKLPQEDLNWMGSIN